MASAVLLGIALIMLRGDPAFVVLSAPVIITAYILL